MSGFNFTCPYCSRAQTVTRNDSASDNFFLHMRRSALGHLGIKGIAICCANPDCNQPTVRILIQKAEALQSGGKYWLDEDPILNVQLLPESCAKPQPEFIPLALREDYLEACRIRDLSPKASATLARRCLQGMIRDFAGVNERSLYEEIEKLNKLAKSGDAPKGVSEDSIDSLHHVRNLGNIGAHMEKDINVIIPVDPEEAQILIDLKRPA